MTIALASAFDQGAEGQSSWQATLDSLPDSLVVVNHLGDIVAVNRSWTDFAAKHAGVDVGVGANYLHTCDRAAASDPIAAEVSTALRNILGGTRASYEAVYPCHGAGVKRWFLMRVARFLGGGTPRLVVTHHDVTLRHEAEQRSHERAELLNAVNASIVATDLHGTVTQWSGGAEGLYGWDEKEMMGRSVALMVPPSDRRRVIDEILPAVIERGEWDGELEVCGRDAAPFRASVRLRLLRDTDARPVGVVGVSIDMTQRLATERQLRGSRDFLSAVTHTMADGLLVLDADGLVTLANKSAETMLGWPEAELLGKPLHEQTHAVTAAGAPRPIAERPFMNGNGNGTTSRVFDDVFQRRDGSLLAVSYSAAPFTTESGERGGVVVFSDVTEQRVRDRRIRAELDALSWVGRIRDAHHDDRLALYAQPIVDLASGEVAQHELLVRLIARDGEIVAPGTFLPVAEEHGLIRMIDRRVLELAMPYAADGHRIAINLSAESLSDPGLFGSVQDLLETHDVAPELVVFEITETALIDDEGVAQAFIENVRRLGAGVALDDFGTGFGSFRYLKHLPVTLLKIDQQFVQDRDGEASKANRHVIEAIVALAQGMGQKTIGEGVETESELEVLRELGVDYAQGYWFARPAPADDVLRKGAVTHV
jgi:PAS domain S-box-containing protein